VLSVAGGVLFFGILWSEMWVEMIIQKKFNEWPKHLFETSRKYLQELL
jgi:hypothetical protein